MTHTRNPVPAAVAGRERFRLRITLLDSEPEIWRTIDVDGSLRLDELHDAIQLAMGWHDTHLHEFSELDPYPVARGIPRIGRTPHRWMPADQVADAADGAAYSGIAQSVVDEQTADVASVFEPFDGPFFYWYDFGDDWWHRIDLIEREVVDAPGASSPPWTRRVELVAGERRGPFEDAGGMHGYADILDALADPSAPDHAEVSAWAADAVWPETSVDPDAFDRDLIDDELALRFERTGDADDDAHAGDGLPLETAAPMLDLLTRLPGPLRSALRRQLRATGALEPIDIEADVAARMVRPYAWLLGRVGADGLALTKAGWMPPAVVLEGMTELGWIDDWFGAGNREDLTSPIRELRESARRFGLVRVAKGRLLRTAAGTRLLDDPIALWRALAHASAERHRTDAENLAAVLAAVELACGRSGELRHLGLAIARGLTALGWRRAEGYPLDQLAGLELVRDTWRLLDSLGVFGEHTPRAPRRTEADLPSPEGRAFARAMLGMR